MENELIPKLRTVNKFVPAFPLNEFPKEFSFALDKEIILSNLGFDENWITVEKITS
jgi:hypothetical protein